MKSENFVYFKKMMLYGLHSLSKYVPRKKRKWIFGSHFKFSDNSKYLFYKVCENNPEIRAIWISNNQKDVGFLRSRGYEVYYRKSMAGVYHTLTAGVVVSNAAASDVGMGLTGGAFFLNLWHGVGVKKIRWLNPDYYIKKFHLKDESEMKTSFRFKLKYFYVLFRKIDLCLVPSKMQADEFFKPMMRITDENILLGGYPRNELLLKDKDEVHDFIVQHEPASTLSFLDELSKYQKVFIYMPTWRNNKADFVTAANIDWNQMNSILVCQNSLLILKLHPNTVINLDFITQYSNIILYPEECDIYTILPYTDCLITDYSSIYSDYCLLNKEIILFVYDYEEYVTNAIDLLDYDKYYLGKKAHSFSELINIIANKVDCHLTKEEYSFIMNAYWDSVNNGVDIAKEVEKRIGIIS